jgi:hypothetical protein
MLKSTIAVGLLFGRVRCLKCEERKEKCTAGGSKAGPATGNP